MPNVNKVTQFVVNDPLAILLAEGTFHPSFDTRYNKTLTMSFPVGKSFEVPLPYEMITREGEEADFQNVSRKTVTVAMRPPMGCDFDYTGFEEALELNRGESSLREDFTEPAGIQLASLFNGKLGEFIYLNVPYIAGQLGTNPTTIQTFHEASQRLIQHGTLPGPLRTYMTPGMKTSFMSANTAIFNPNDDIADMWREGKIGMLSDSKTFQSVHIKKHTTGVVTSAAALTVAGAVASGSRTVTINCTTGDTFLRGDRVAFAASYYIHPRTRETFGTTLADQAVYIVQQSVTGAASTATLTLDRPIIGPPPNGAGQGDPYANVNALPINLALVTRWPGTTIPDGQSVTGSIGAVLNKGWAALVSAKLRMPKNQQAVGQARDPQSGMTMSLVQSYGIQRWTYPTRMDLWIGLGGLYPQNCAIALLGA